MSTKNTQTPLPFRSEGHKDRFTNAVTQMDKVYDGYIDQEYGAALYILTSNAGVWNKAQAYIGRRINFADFLEETPFSSGESTMARLAWNLFSSRTSSPDNLIDNEQVWPVELSWLDEANFATALSALLLRRHGATISGEGVACEVRLRVFQS